MPAAWPVTVPLRFAPGSRESGPMGSFIETPFDRGRPARRRDSLAGPRRMPVRLARVSETEIAIVEAWFEGVLSGGAESFEMPHPRTGAIRSFAFADPERPFEIEHIIGRWSALTMETRNFTSTATSGHPVSSRGLVPSRRFAYPSGRCRRLRKNAASSRPPS